MLLEELLRQPLHPNQHIRALYLLGKISEHQAHFEQAFIYLNRAIQLPAEELSLDAHHDVLILASNLFTRAKAFSLAENYARQSLDVALESKDVGLECISKATVAIVNRYADKVEAAIKTSLQQVEVCAQAGNLLVQANGELAVGWLPSDDSTPKESLAWLERAYSKFESLNYIGGLVSTKIKMSKVRLELQQVGLAQALIVEAIQDAEKYQAWDDLELAYPIAAILAERGGNLKDAMAWHKKYMAAAEKVRNNNKAIRLAYLQTQFKIEQSKQKSSIKDKEQQILLLKQNNQYLWTAVTILGWLLFFALAFIGYQQFKRRRRVATSEWARNDDLTGLLKRYYGCESASSMLQTCLDNRQSFIALVADIDHCGTINNNFGHDVGDIVLGAVAERLAYNAPDSAIVCRGDSDEFLIFVPDYSAEQTAELIECYQRSMNNIVVDGRPMNVALSFGFVDGPADLNLDERIHHAEIALKEAKFTGRNRAINAGNLDLQEARIRHAASW